MELVVANIAKVVHEKMNLGDGVSGSFLRATARQTGILAGQLLRSPGENVCKYG